MAFPGGATAHPSILNSWQPCEAVPTRHVADSASVAVMPELVMERGTVREGLTDNATVAEGGLAAEFVFDVTNDSVELFC